MNSKSLSDNSSSSAIFPGSFDPMTNGHFDIIERSLTLFDTLTIAILENSQKVPLFSVAERIALIEAECRRFNEKRVRVQVRSFSGLLVDFAKHEQCHIVVRGLRAISDYDYEAQMALMNKSLYRDLETVFLIAREENSYISSSIVKQVALLRGDITKFVPPGIKAAILQKLSHSA
jgi:pantetheine-phosphate adenylyltransferase